MGDSLKRVSCCIAVSLASFIPLARAVRAQVAEPVAGLRAGFKSPPEQAKLRCYWWWLNGNTTEETITRDLTEMSRKGFGGVLLVDANGSSQNGNEPVPAGPVFGSPAWVRLYVHALKTAAALHLEVTFNITSGWNLGGPDVTPADGAKLLTWARTDVDERGFDGKLPMPPITNGFYQRIAVLAYPLAHGVALPGQQGDHRAPIKQLQFKNASTEMSFSMPPTESLLGDATAAQGEQDTDLSQIVDLSAQVGAGGALQWKPPAQGEWEILQVGYTDSDARVSTSSGAWQGLAIDYLDRGAFDRYWTHTLEPLLVVSRPYLKTTLVNLATDSWELGGTNWTGRFRKEFESRRGYDPVRYLPVVTGRIVQDRATSARFLNDLRRTVGDLVTDHYDHFAERAKVYGLGIQCESGGPHGAPFDGLETFRSAAVPQTEYWAQSNEHRSRDEDRFFTKEAASAADIYGKQFAAQEGMTSIGPQWSESLATDLKPSFDQAVTEGMNRLVWHEFTSAPKEFGLPGNEYFAGTHLNPNVTWWQQGGEFFRYLNRSQYLLQQGHAVDDVLYFYGDEVPNFVRLKRDDPARVLPGYDYDVTNEDALLRTLQVKDGVISTPGGNSYRLMVMPRGRRLSVASLKRIAGYVKQGGRVVGERPTAPTGLTDAAASREFEELTQAMWGACDEGSHAYGKGTVFCGVDARAALKQVGVAEDFEDASGQLDYVHRRDGAREIYFVRNVTGHTVDVSPVFRVEGRQPEIWDAVTGEVSAQALYQIQDGRTTLPMHLAPYASAFVIFEAKSGLHVTQVLKDGVVATGVDVVREGPGGYRLVNALAGVYELKLSNGGTAIAELNGDEVRDIPASQWTIAFQPDRGAPNGGLPLDGFKSWADSAQEGVRYFSGTATYRTEMDVQKESGRRALLSLTELHEICTVRVNGEDAGTIWAMPYRLDITDKLKPGRNTIEVEVTNLWPNRLIGDAQPGVTQTYTRTNIRKYTADSPLLPSGLIGPVSLVMVGGTTMK